eukprot:21516_1
MSDEHWATFQTLFHTPKSNSLHSFSNNAWLMAGYSKEYNHSSCKPCGKKFDGGSWVESITYKRKKKLKRKRKKTVSVVRSICDNWQEEFRNQEDSAITDTVNEYWDESGLPSNYVDATRWKGIRKTYSKHELIKLCIKNKNKPQFGHVLTKKRYVSASA